MPHNMLFLVLFTSLLTFKCETNASLRIYLIAIAMAENCVTSLGIHDNSNRPRREDDSVNCKAGVVAAGRNANITCNFNIDVNETKHDFIVEAKPPHVPDTNRPKTVLWCHWRGPVKLECDLLEGVSFNYVVSDHISVEISKATEQFAGLYTCRTVPPDNRPVRHCNLIVKSTVPSIWDPKSSTAELTTSTGTCTHSECSSNGTVEILAVVTALTTCLVVVLIVVIVILRKRLKKMGNSNRARGISDLNATGGHQDGAVLMETDPVIISAVMTQVDPSQCLARVK